MKDYVVKSISSTSLLFPFLSTFEFLSQSYRHESYHLPDNLTFAATIFPIQGFAVSIQSLTFPSFFVTAIPCTTMARPDCGSMVFLDVSCLGGLVLCPLFAFLDREAVDFVRLSGGGAEGGSDLFPFGSVLGGMFWEMTAA
ncbi:hypothetical protein BDZ91DRAFT_744812 [Kalaharituber pfeilii]|nr:hypothetical protein BDZ91DRAFT_744812 [Kalaharituber pfeilii]